MKTVVTAADQARARLLRAMLDASNGRLFECVQFLSQHAQQAAVAREETGSCWMAMLRQMLIGLDKDESSAISAAVNPRELVISMLRVLSDSIDTDARKSVALLILDLFPVLTESFRNAFIAHYCANDDTKYRGGEVVREVPLAVMTMGNRELLFCVEAMRDGLEHEKVTVADFSLLPSTFFEKEEESVDSRESRDQHMVVTPTCSHNKNRLKDVSKGGIPILLEGGTGVGKSATVSLASREESTKLVRYNMSRNTTIDELLGQVKMKSNPDSGIVEFELELGPFAMAFKHGHWMLLDEFNLAQDTVLQCIEQALDSHELLINDLTGGESQGLEGEVKRATVKRIPMHSNFRLFATQNPNSGLFKGKREPLSQSLLSRFLAVTFNELPADEWCDILGRELSRKKDKLPDDFQCELASKLVRFHMMMSKLHAEPSTSEPPPWQEQNGSVRPSIDRPIKQLLRNPEETKAPYAVFSIRDVLQVISHVNLDRDELDTDYGALDTFKEQVIFQVWNTYGDACMIRAHAALSHAHAHAHVHVLHVHVHVHVHAVSMSMSMYSMYSMHMDIPPSVLM
jgi:MoxR-like ATPase